LSHIPTGKGVVKVASQHPFDETVIRLESAIESRGLTVFARINFSGDAERVGLKLNPTRLFIFGNPKAGTPVIQAAPSSAIDLPLRVLVSADQGGRTWLSYDSPEYLGERHGIPTELLKNISGISSIVESVAGKGERFRGTLKSDKSSAWLQHHAWDEVD
jgi:uncharacterized protein (DUF302 family)